jgi:uncharacterized protein (UPF0332 family)
VTLPPTPAAGLERARRALQEAQDNTRLGHHAVAINRAYYAALYASLALLKSIGIDAKTHEGVHALISQHFVRSGALPPETGRRLKHLEGDRELADYDLLSEPSAQDAADTLAEATRYVDDAARVLGLA